MQLLGVLFGLSALGITDCFKFSSACRANPSCKLNFESHFGQVTRVCAGRSKS
jgi:hypothetical protein